MLGMQRAVPVRQQDRQRLTQDLRSRVAEDPFGALIEEKDVLRPIHADHRVGRDGDDSRKELVREATRIQRRVRCRGYWTIPILGRGGGVWQATLTREWGRCRARSIAERGVTCMPKMR